MRSFFIHLNLLAMKKWILSAAFLLAFTGYCAAQKTTTTSKPVTEKAAKSGTIKSKGTDTSPVIKKDVSTHQAKVRLELPAVDTTGTVPRQKDQ